MNEIKILRVSSSHFNSNGRSQWNKIYLEQFALVSRITSCALKFLFNYSKEIY